MPSLFNNIILISLINIFPFGYTGSAYFTNQRQQSSLSTSGGGGIYGEHGQYYGNKNVENGLELRSDEGNGGRRRSKILYEQQQQRLQSSNNNYNKKQLFNSEMTNAAFIFEDYCIERCQIPCSTTVLFLERDKEPQIQFNCAKLKPPERKLHEKLVASISSASIFEFFVAGIIILSIGICCVCSCYQCFCKNPQIVHRYNNKRSNNNNEDIPPNGIITHHSSLNCTGTKSTGPEHDPLVFDKIPHIDEGIQPEPLISNNYNKHHYITKTTNNTFNGSGGEHSIV